MAQRRMPGHSIAKTIGLYDHKDAVFRYYEGPPNNWTKAQVDSNLFAKYAQNISHFSAMDPASIMMYPIPVGFTTNGFTVGWNRVLSPMDKQLIQRWYPPFQVRINLSSQVSAGVQRSHFERFSRWERKWI